MDAGVGYSVEQRLRHDGHEVLAVRDRNPHMPDTDILAWASAEQALIITMDKDFGDLVWKEQRPHTGILLLRLEEATGPERATIAAQIIKEFATELPGKFAVYKQERLRINR